MAQSATAGIATQSGPPPAVSTTVPGIIPVLSGSASDVFNGAGSFAYPAITNSSITGAGTALSLTQSMQTLTFGTTSPQLVLAAGTWLLLGHVTFQDTGGVGGDTLECQLYNITDSAAIGNICDALAGKTTLSNVTATLFSVVTLAATKTVGMQAVNTSQVAGTVIAAKSDLTAVRLA